MSLSTSEIISGVEWWRTVRSYPLKGNLHITSEQRTSHARNQVLHLREKFLSECLVCASRLPLRTRAQEHPQNRVWGDHFQLIFTYMRRDRDKIKFCQNLNSNSILGPRGSCILDYPLRIPETLIISTPETCAGVFTEVTTRTKLCRRCIL